jgi:TusA-related sulfurtransferase
VPKTLAEVASGQVLKILSTDPGSVKDFAAFATDRQRTAVHRRSGWRIHLLHEEEVSARQTSAVCS